MDLPTESTPDMIVCCAARPGITQVAAIIGPSAWNIWVNGVNDSNGHQFLEIVDWDGTSLLAEWNGEDFNFYANTNPIGNRLRRDPNLHYKGVTLGPHKLKNWESSYDKKTKKWTNRVTSD